MRRPFLNTCRRCRRPKTGRPSPPADRLTDRGRRSGNGLGPRRPPPSDHQEERQSTGAEAGRADPSRRGSRRDPRPTSGGNRLTETSGHGADGRDGSHETFVARRSRAVQSTAHANAYVERVIGSIRRECLDHVIVANEAGLRWVRREYLAYYLHSRTHLALDKDAPISRSIVPPSAGRVVATPEVGGLHHATTASPHSRPIAVNVPTAPSAP